MMLTRRCIKGELISRLLLVAVLLCAVVMPAVAYGQATDAPQAVSGAGTDPGAIKMSLKEIFDTGGWVMYVLTAFSLMTVSLVVFFVLSLRASQTGPADFQEEIVKLIRMDAYEDAVRACEFKNCALSSIAMAGLEHVRGVSEVSPAILKDVLQGAGARQADRFQGQTQYLLDIAVISPMLGLLGTVFGMLRAFNAVALDIASAKPVVLAGGVREALITTACGLLVGIPAMIFYAYFRRRASVLVSALEAQTASIFNAFCTKRVR